MIELLEYPFMQRALIGGLLIGISCSLLGVFLVLRRLSLLGDGLAHASFGGIALGLLLNINPIHAALGFAVIASLGIDRLIKKIKLYGESAIALVLATGMSFALIIIGFAQGFDYNLFSFLFGSILTLNMNDIYLMIGLLVAVLIFLKIFYKDLVYSTFNEEIAIIRNRNVSIVNRIFIILTAITIVIAIRAVGILLVSALLVIPALIGLQLSKSLKQTLVISMISSIIGIYLGIFLSYVFDIPTGGTIVMSLVVLFVLSIILKNCLNVVTSEK